MKKFLILLLAAPFLSGCFALIAGGAGAAGAYIWTSGNLVRHYQQPFDTTWEGAKHALRVMNLPVAGEENDHFNGEIKSKMPNSKELLVVKLERWTDRETKVMVRAGVLGDRAFSERVHDEIDKALR